MYGTHRQHTASSPSGINLSRCRSYFELPPFWFRGLEYSRVVTLSPALFRQGRFIGPGESTLSHTYTLESPRRLNSTCLWSWTWPSKYRRKYICGLNSNSMGLPQRNRTSNVPPQRCTTSPHARCNRSCVLYSLRRRQCSAHRSLQIDRNN
jgi:hypothetical protein